MKRMIALMLCLCLFLVLFAGCGEDEDPHVPTGDALVMEGQDPESVYGKPEEDPQEITLVYYPDRSLNPLESTDFTNRALFSLIYQGLFSVDANWNPTPILCKQYYISADSRSYTIYIENATFSDGTPLTINDVLATYEAARKSDYYKGRFTHIKDISLSGDGGITFTLDTPFENLPLLLDIPILKANQLEAEIPLGSGPYALESSIAGAHLRKVLNWWGKQSIVVTADSIPLVKAESPSQIRDEFEFNDLSLVCANPCADAYADYRCDYELWDCDNGVFLYLGCNVTYSDVFSDERVRSALTYAIDREALAENIYRGFALPATLPASPRSPYYSASLADRYTYDPMRFIDALNAYGIIGEPVSLLVNSDDSMRIRTARAIKEMLEECGLPVELNEQPTYGFIRALGNGDYDLYLGQTKLSANMDLSSFYGPWAPMSLGGLSNPNIYSLCLSALANRGNYYDLHKAAADDGRVTSILFSGYAIYATRGLVTDLNPSRDNVFYYSLGKNMEDARIPTVYDNPG